MMIRTLSALGCWLVLCLPMAGGDVTIVAHRGASKDAPENTLPAFRLAWEQGAGAIEGDFHLTKDGHIVCLHDANTKKVSKKDLVVRSTVLAELRRLDVGAGHGEAFKGTSIPTIAEVFATIPPEKKIYIEIKCGPEIIPPLLREIDESGLTSKQVVIISFKEKVIQEIKIKAPQYEAFWLCRFEEKKSGEITPSLDHVMKTLELVRADGLSSCASVPLAVVGALEKQGFQWHVWTINDVTEARRLLDWGAQSITTDIPGEMIKGLDGKPPAIDLKKSAPGKE